MGELTLTDTFEIAREVSKLVRLAQPLAAARQEKASSEEYKEAVRSYDRALRETVAYIQSVERDEEQNDPGLEFELSQLWSDASIAISEFDPHLANRCFIKGQGWLNPTVWKSRRYKKYRIGIDDMREALMELHQEQFARQRAQAPRWFPKAGLGFAIATFLSLSYLLWVPISRIRNGSYSTRGWHSA